MGLKEDMEQLARELTELDAEIQKLMARRNIKQRQLEAYHLLTDRPAMNTG